jgi:predicted RNA binding protein YcfA (HicA-like mRNA interferase family)
MVPLTTRVVKRDQRVRVRDLIRLLEADGWRQVRMRGSHRQFHHPWKRGTVMVAGHSSLELPPRTLRSVLKQAGLNKERT